MENYKRLLNELKKVYKKAPKYEPIKWKLYNHITGKFLVITNIYWLNDKITEIIKKYSENYYIEDFEARIKISIRIKDYEKGREGE